MNTHSRFLVAAVGLLAVLPVLRAADEQPPGRDDKKQMRVLSGPERERRPFLTRDGDKKIEKETVAFLGVETSPVSAAMSAQLSLARGTGLVVNHVVPKSPAEGVLNEHDILLKLDDQILIETRQLSVLIRNHKEGDSVVVTYLRAGQKATATIKLGKHDVPKFAGAFGGTMFPFNPGGPNSQFDYITIPGPDGGRADVDDVLSMIRRSPNGEPMRFQFDRQVGPGFRALAVHTGNSSLVFSDEAGSLELTMKDGAKTLVAKNSKGEQLFSGSVNTPEERKAMPVEVRERLEKLEDMHSMTFRTDGDFQGTETRVMHPRGIGFPLPPPESRQPSPSRLFY